MAGKVLRSAGVGALGFAMALVVQEAKTPGSASQTVETTVNAAVPVVQGVGIFGGETLSATGPVAQGARNAMSGFGTAVGQAPQTTEDTLPTTPLGGN